MSQNQFTPIHGDPSQLTLEQRWSHLRSKVGERWPQLTKDDLALIDGDSRKLVALVHQKTGADVSEIEADIDEIAASSLGLLERVTRSVQGAATTAAHRVSEPVAQAYHSVHDQIESTPGRAAGVAFGLGILIGLGAASLLKDVREPPRRSRFGYW